MIKIWNESLQNRLSKSWSPFTENLEQSNIRWICYSKIWFVIMTSFGLLLTSYFPVKTNEKPVNLKCIIGLQLCSCQLYFVKGFVYNEEGD